MTKHKTVKAVTHDGEEVDVWAIEQDPEDEKLCILWTTTGEQLAGNNGDWSGKEYKTLWCEETAK